MCTSDKARGEHTVDEMVWLMCNSTLEMYYIDCNRSGSDGELNCEGVIMYQGDQLTSLRCDQEATMNICDCKTDCKDNDTNNQTSVASYDTQSTVLNEANTDVCYSASVVIGLGALVGLLVLLVAVTITGWIWTYWAMRNRGRMNFTSEPVG